MPTVTLGCLPEMKIAKPRYLYHGSPEKLDRIEPRPARGVGPEKDRLNAVYATHIQNLAIVFSLPFIPNENNNLSFQVSFQTDEPEIHLEAGSLDMSRPGFLYTLPSASFGQLDDEQWVSYGPVEPCGKVRINPKDFLHWLR